MRRPAWAAANIALGLLVLVCAFVAVAIPRASLGFRTEALQRVFGSQTAFTKSVLGDAAIASAGMRPLTAAQLGAATSQLRASLLHDGVPLAPPSADWAGLTTIGRQFGVEGVAPSRTMAPPRLELLYRSGLPGNVTSVAGSLPASASINGQSGTFQIVVTTATAAKFGLRVGSRLHMAGQELVVTGIVQPRQLGSVFWTADPVASAPRLITGSPTAAPYIAAAAFIGPGELAAMQQFLSLPSFDATWAFPLVLRSVDADQAAGLLGKLQTLGYLPAVASVSTGLTNSTGGTGAVDVSLSSGLQIALSPFVATDNAIQGALSLLFVSLAVIAAVVVLLGTRLVTERRSGEFGTMRARGASLRQLGITALAGGVVGVLPAAVAALAGAVLVTPGHQSLQSWWLASVIVAAALAGPVVLATWRHRTGRPTTAARARQRGRTSLAGARRWVADGALILGAVACLVLLRERGGAGPGGSDLFLSAAPVLVAVPIALIVMRGYPVVLRQLTKVAARRRGVVLVVGFARGNAVAVAGVLPAFALVLAFAVIAFATMARVAVARANVAASWQVVGADAVVTAPATGEGITPAVERRIASVPGVRRWAPIVTTTGTSTQGVQLQVFGVDPRRYAALFTGTSAPPFPAAAIPGRKRPRTAPPSEVPILISPVAKAELGSPARLSVAGRTLAVRVTGVLSEIAGAQQASPFAVLPNWAFGSRVPAPGEIALVGQNLDGAALSRAARTAMPGAQVTLRSRQLAGLSAQPLPHGGFVTFAEGAVTAGAFSLLVLLLTLVLGARAREMTLARLATMGLRPAQARRVVAAEVLPAVLAAAAGGAACALALAPLVGPALDVAAFTGVPVTVPLRPDLLALAVATGGLLAVTLLALTIQSGHASRRGTSQALRVGE